ncbi:MAG: PorV/PorQ family protein [Ignavibacteria bacterium]
MNYKLKISLVILILISFIENIMAGPRDRFGTNAADELLIPVGSIGTSLGGSNMASITGIESMYWNPAGLSKINSNTGEAMFSYMNYIADINMQYFGTVVRIGNLGNLGLSIRSLDFGSEELVTTISSPEGTGEKFTPTYIVGNLSFARAMTDKIYFGSTVKLISESIADVSATSFAFDVGLQYIAGSSGIKFGIALKNLGPRIKFDGPGLDRSYTENGTTVIRRITLQEFELPTNLEIGLTYNANLGNQNNINMSTSFQSSSYSSDEYKFGLEYIYNNSFFIRAATNVYPEKETDENLFGPSFGAGIKYPVGNIKLGFDYAYRILNTDGFNSTNQYFTLNIGF